MGNAGGFVSAIRFIDNSDNYQAVRSFIGDAFAKCKKCGGSGEYESEYGPVSCQPCNSRCIAVTTPNGVRYADWGDWIIRVGNDFYVLSVETGHV